MSEEKPKRKYTKRSKKWKYLRNGALSRQRVIVTLCEMALENADSDRGRALAFAAKTMLNRR